MEPHVLILGAMNGIEIFKKEAENIHEYFPELLFNNNEELPNIEGKILLLDDDNNCIDHYNVRIIGEKSFPYRFPLVYETNGRIPINIDWHIFEQDGHCCIKSLPEEILICKKGISLVDFINEQLTPYFFNQKYREIHGYFKKERAHGNDGNIEFFEETFKTKDLSVILNGLTLLSNEKLPNRTEKCFCGGNEKYRKCHKSSILEIKEFTKQELDFFSNLIFLKKISSQAKINSI